jgi:hypothetical protein
LTSLRGQSDFSGLIEALELPGKVEEVGNAKIYQADSSSSGGKEKVPLQILNWTKQIRSRIHPKNRELLNLGEEYLTKTMTTKSSNIYMILISLPQIEKR